MRFSDLTLVYVCVLVVPGILFLCDPRILVSRKLRHVRWTPAEIKQGRIFGAVLVLLGVAIVLWRLWARS